MNTYLLVCWINYNVSIAVSLNYYICPLPKKWYLLDVYSLSNSLNYYLYAIWVDTWATLFSQVRMILVTYTKLGCPDIKITTIYIKEILVRLPGKNLINMEDF